MFCWQSGTTKKHQQESLYSSADEKLVTEHYFELGEFRYDTIVHSLGEYHEIYMNVRTLKTVLDPGSWIVDVPFKIGFIVAWPLRSSAFSALEAKYCDNDFADEEDEARSSSGLLILTLRCEISATVWNHV